MIIPLLSSDTNNLELPISNKKFYEELITYFSLIWPGLYRKRRLQQFFVAAGTCLLIRCLVTAGGYIDSQTLI
jgi:hypothetical protein